MHGNDLRPRAPKYVRQNAIIPERQSILHFQISLSHGRIVSGPMRRLFPAASALATCYHVKKEQPMPRRKNLSPSKKSVAFVSKLALNTQFGQLGP